MKLYFKNTDTAIDGIRLVLDDLNITLSNEESADAVVTLTEVKAHTLTVTLDHKSASIVYGGGRARFFRALAILANWIIKGETSKSVTENPLFTTNGAMLQQTNTMRIDSIKTILRKMALMGMNAVLFYIEDTYEIEGRPYFGYMRGSYTQAQLKELDSYAAHLGIELIPCIQTLGHLASHLRWSASTPYKDTDNELLVGADATYALINDMLKTVKDCFSTPRVHIGMDETHDLGTGAYLDLNGYRDRRDIYFEHLKRVRDIARGYGLEPMMWSDMFFRLAGKDLEHYREYDERVVFSDEVKARIPKNVRQVFWDYYRPQKAFYATNIKKHRDVFGDDPLFAGGVWCWSGFCPLYSRSLDNTIAALDACREQGVKEVFATVWGGAEHSITLSLPGLAWYADYNYTGTFDIDSVKSCFSRCCDGVSYDEMMLLELPEHPDRTTMSLTRALLHNDPLLGLADKHLEGLPMQEYYKEVTQRLEASRANKGIFAPAYEAIVKISSLLENKADFGVRLKAAYDANDREVLKTLLAECDVIIDKIGAFRKAHRKMWMHYNTPFQWEDFDNGFGGLIARFDTVKMRLSMYLNGEIEHIEELECKRLRLDGRLDEDAAPRFHSGFLWNGSNMYTGTGAVK